MINATSLAGHHEADHVGKVNTSRIISVGGLGSSRPRFLLFETEVYSINWTEFSEIVMPERRSTRPTDFITWELKRSEALGRVSDLILFARTTSEFYRNRFLHVPKILLVQEDLATVPFSSSSDLQVKVPPRHLLTGDPTQSLVFTSGGSSGEPKIVYWTAEKLWTNVAYHGKGYATAGINPTSIVGTFGVPGYLTSEFTVYLGLMRTGSLIVPIGMNNDPERVLRYVSMFHVNTLLVMPSDLMPLLSYLQEKNLELDIPHLVYGGERLFSSTREYLQKRLHVRRFNSTFQSIDVGTIGFQCEHCTDGQYHIHDTLQYIECVNEQGNYVDDGEIGELVITNLHRRLLPVIRYKTGDLVRRLPESCPCGITNPKIELLGRRHEAIKLAGELFRLEAFGVPAARFTDLTGEFQITLEKDHAMDRLRITYETTGATSQGIRASQIVDYLLGSVPKLRDLVAARVMHPVVVNIVNREAMLRSPSSGKIISVNDLRE